MNYIKKYLEVILMTDKERADQLDTVLSIVSYNLDSAYEMFCQFLNVDLSDENRELREAYLTVICRSLQEAKRKADCIVNPESEVIKLFEQDLSDMRALIEKFNFEIKTVS